METLLLQTKLFIPSLRTGIIPRVQLLKRLNVGLERKLTLIAAPAGFGKTTAAVEWLRQLDNVSSVWLSLDEADNDPARFWVYFIGAVQTAVPDFGYNVLTMLQAPQPPPPDILFTSLVNEFAHLKNKLVLVLDDYHLIEAQPIHAMVSFLLNHAPSQLHLALTTRADPPLPLARLRARGEMTELRMVDLQFTAEETAVFLNQSMGLSLSSDEITALKQRTEGWAAGLQMAALALQNTADPIKFIQTFTGDNRYIMDYLAEEVLQQQPAATRDFLLQTAILSRLSGPLCDAVTEMGNGRATLEILERDNLFILPLDDNRTWYRYNHLFATLLQNHLSRSHEALILDLHCRASTWFAANGFLTEAINHALNGQDFEQAVQLVKDNGLALLQRGEMATLLGWLGQLPEEKTASDAWLQLYFAWALLLSGQHTALEPYLRQTEALLPTLPPLEQKRVSGHSAAIQAYSATFDQNLPQAIDLANQALTLLPGDDWIVRSVVAYTLGGISYLSGDLPGAMAAFAEASLMGQQAGNIHVALPALCALGDMQAGQGAWDLAKKSYEQVIEIGLDSSGNPLPVAASGYVGMAEVHMQQKDFTAAKAFLDTGLKLSKRWGNPDNLVGAYLAAAQLSAVTGDEQAAQDAIVLVEETAVTHTLSPEMPAVIAARKKQILDHLEKSPTPLIEPLSERELEVLRLIAAGLSNREIAEQLIVAMGTVKAHTSAIYRKLDVNGRTQAVIQAKLLEILT